MKNKFIFLGVLSLMMVMLMQIAMAVPTATVVAPATGAKLNGTTAILNFTYTGTLNMTTYNITWSARSLSTANNSYTTVATRNNVNLSTAIITHNNITISSKLLEDSNDYSFRVALTLFNSSTFDDVTATATTGVIVDNTIPQAATSTLPATSTKNTDGKPTFSGTVTNANTTSCTLNFISGGGYITPQQKGYAMSYSASTCTLSFGTTSLNQMFATGRYGWYITASDGTNSTDTSTFVLDVDKKSNTGKMAAIQLNQQLQNIEVQQQQGQKAKSNNLVLFVVAAVVLFIIYSKTKK